MQDEFGMTVLLTTHYMEEADALCDRVALHAPRPAAGGRFTDRAEADRLDPEATLEDVFRHYAGADLDEDDRRRPESRQIRSSRRTARRVS